MKTKFQSFCYLFCESRIIESRIKSSFLTSNEYVPEWVQRGYVTSTVHLQKTTYTIYKISITDFGYDLLTLHQL